MPPPQNTISDFPPTAAERDLNERVFAPVAELYTAGIQSPAFRQEVDTLNLQLDKENADALIRTDPHNYADTITLQFVGGAIGNIAARAATAVLERPGIVEFLDHVRTLFKQNGDPVLLLDEAEATLPTYEAAAHKLIRNIREIGVVETYILLTSAEDFVLNSLGGESRVKTTEDRSLDIAGILKRSGGLVNALGVLSDRAEHRALYNNLLGIETDMRFRTPLLTEVLRDSRYRIPLDRLTMKGSEGRQRVGLRALPSGSKDAIGCPMMRKSALDPNSPPQLWMKVNWEVIAAEQSLIKGYVQLG